MHLSPLSEGFLDGTSTTSDVSLQHGRAHRDGLIRGLAVLAIVGVLMGLGFVSSVHSAPAPYDDDLIHCAIAER